MMAGGEDWWIARHTSRTKSAIKRRSQLTLINVPRRRTFPLYRDLTASPAAAACRRGSTRTYIYIYIYARTTTLGREGWREGGGRREDSCIL